ncbi:unnamed protein product [Arabidopsis lyrata]|nr:unnamed protein product [Arabidopsis lyrata]
MSCGCARAVVGPDSSFLEAVVTSAAESVLLGFQHYLVLGTTVLISSALVPQMGGREGAADPDNTDFWFLRPSSSYILWCKDQWAEVKKQNPEADFKETIVGKVVFGTKWCVV